MSERGTDKRHRPGSGARRWVLLGHQHAQDRCDRRILAAINSAGNPLDSTGAQAAHKVWERGGCVTVSVWTNASYRERHFQPQQDLRIHWATGAPPLKELVGVMAWGINMRVLEQRE